MAANSGLSDEEKIKIVADYLQSGMSQKKYHEVNDFPYHINTLQRWCVKFKIQALQKNGHEIKGISTLYDSEGNVKLTWVKTNKEADNTKRLLQAFADGLKDDIPKAIPTLKPDQTKENLLALYVLSDAHIGMRSDEWNLEIAERIVKGFIDNAVKQAPDAHTGVFCFQGDIGHWDSMLPVTPASKHVLDADCNSRDMVRLISRLIRYAVSKMMVKHDKVHIIYCAGNHDEFTATVMSEWLDIHYSDEPRVTVDTDNTLYHAYEWGMTSLFFHHGHKRNITQVSNVFAGMFREIFGRTKYSYGHIGHFHHTAKSENQLMQVEIHPTLAGKDDYALNGGYLSQRGAHTIIYHKHHGEVGRITIRPEMCL